MTPLIKNETQNEETTNSITNDIEKKFLKKECEDIGKKQIDEKKTFEKFGYYSNELSIKSHKKVVSVCDECGKERDIQYHAYRDKCHKCVAVKSAIKMAKISAIKRKGTHHKPETIEKMRKSAGVGINHHSYGTHPTLETRKKLSECRKGSKNYFYGKHHTEETKKKLSDIRKKNPTHLGKPASHGKHINYTKLDGNIVKFRSSWEYKVAKYLDENKIEWEYENLTLPIKYCYNGECKNGTLTIDFQLKNTNEIWEIKGYWRDDAKEKFEAVCSQYPNYNFKLLDKTKLKFLKIL